MLDKDPDKKLREILRTYKYEPDDSLWSFLKVRLSSSDLIGERLKAYKEIPSGEVWLNVNRKLDVTLLRRKTARVVFVATLLSLSNPIQLHDSFFCNWPSLSITQAVDTKPHNISTGKNMSSGKGNQGIGGSGAEKKLITGNKLNNKSDKGSSLRDATWHGYAVKTENKGERDLHNIESLRNHKLSTARIDSVDRFEIKNDLDSMGQSMKRKLDSVASENSVKEHAKSRLAFYGSITPSLGYFDISPNPNDASMIQGYTKDPSLAFSRFALRIEVGAEKQLNPKVSLAFGAMYFHHTYRINYSSTDLTGDRITPVSGQPFVYQIAGRQESTNSHFDLTEIGLSAGLNYLIREKNLIHRVGFSGEVHSGTQIDAHIIFYGSAYYRINYRVNKNWDFILQPSVNHAMNRYNEIQNKFRLTPYNFGISLGLIFKLDNWK